MATRAKDRQVVSFFAVLLHICVASLAEKSDGLKIECGEIDLTITVTRQWFEETGIPFKHEFVRLGRNPTRRRSCVPAEPTSESEMVISAGLRDCGTESSVREEGLQLEQRE